MSFSAAGTGQTSQPAHCPLIMRPKAGKARIMEGRTEHTECGNKWRPVEQGQSMRVGENLFCSPASVEELNLTAEKYNGML